MSRIATAIVRSPALHFVVLGVLLFYASTLLGSPARARGRAPIVITAARVDVIREDYERTMGAPPTPAELDALIAREADDEMLYHEALLLGLDRGDPAVEWRVIEKMEFLFGHGSGDNAEALRRGLALGLQRDDIVVRSGLITKMRLLAKGSSLNDEPSGDALEKALAAYFARHQAAYAKPVLITLTQVFLRGDATHEPDALALRARIDAAGMTPAAATKLGDPFAAGNVVRATSLQGLAKMFGNEAAEAVMKAEPNRWSEPIRSPYGFHIVWVSERRDGGIPELAAVRSQVLQAYRAERQQEHLRRMMSEIRAAYEVRVEPGAGRDA